MRLKTGSPQQGPLTQEGDSRLKEINKIEEEKNCGSVDAKNLSNKWVSCEIKGAKRIN